MSTHPGDNQDVQISSDATYWPMHMERFGDDTFDLSDRATGCFVRFMNFYVKRNGNVPFEEGKLCERLRYKTVRSFRPVWEELCAAGVIVVAKGMVTCAFGDFVLDQIRKARKQKSDSGKEGAEARARTMAERKAAEGSGEHTGGIAGEYDGNTTAIAAEREGTIEQKQTLSFGSASQLKIKNENKKEEAPLPPQAVPAKVMNGHANGISSVESDHAQAIVQAFDKLIVEFWGKQAARFAPADNDIDTAAKWLAHMEGDASGVIQAIDDCMADEANRGRKAPPRLSFYNGSIPRFMAAASQPVTLTAMSKPGAGQAKAGPKPTWVEVQSLANKNFHDDIAKHIRALAGSGTPEETAAANAYAESVREHVSRKKERAAA